MGCAPAMWAALWLLAAAVAAGVADPGGLERA